MGQLRDKIHRVIFRVFTMNPGRLAGSTEEHRAIAEAIIAGDATLAARRIEEHLHFGKISLLNARRE